MPMVRIVSNVPDSKIPEDFEVRFAKVILILYQICCFEVLSTSMNKPEERIAVEVQGGARLVHGGDRKSVV